MLNLMVKYQEEMLDRTFAALSDPTRRALLARLGSRDSLSVSELAQPFSMSLPAIMKHLDVLSDAGLIARAKTGRVVACRLTADPRVDAGLLRAGLDPRGPEPAGYFLRVGPRRVDFRGLRVETALEGEARSGDEAGIAGSA